MRKFLGVVLMILMFVPLCMAQTTDLVALRITGSEIHYTLPHIDTTVSRVDLLTSLPEEGRYQHIANDIALAKDLIEHSGGVVNIPPVAQDSIIILLDSLRALEAEQDAAIQEAATIIETQRSTIISQTNEISSLNQTITQRQQVIDQLRGRVTEMEARVSAMENQMQAVVDELQLVIDSRGRSIGRLRQILEQIRAQNSIQ